MQPQGFAPTELEFLYKRFRFLCKRGVNLSRSDLQSNPNLADNQYVRRVFGVMPKNEMGEVTFDVFVRTAGLIRTPSPCSPKVLRITGIACQACLKLELLCSMKDMT